MRAAVGKARKGGPSPQRTHFPSQAGREGRAKPCAPQDAHASFTGGPWSGIVLPDSQPRRECACAVAESRHLCFPSPCSPAGAPGRVEPCSPAPAPVGFVSTGCRHPRCPLHATLRTLRRRLEAAGARGVAGGLRADHPGARTFWWFRLVGGSGHRPHLSRGGGGGEWGLSPGDSPGPHLSPRCDVQVLQELLQIASAVRVRLGALLVSWPGPLSSAVRVPG